MPDLRGIPDSLQRAAPAIVLIAALLAGAIFLDKTPRAESQALMSAGTLSSTAWLEPKEPETAAPAMQAETAAPGEALKELQASLDEANAEIEEIKDSLQESEAALKASEAEKEKLTADLQEAKEIRATEASEETQALTKNLGATQAALKEAKAQTEKLADELEKARGAAKANAELESHCKRNSTTASRR